VRKFQRNFLFLSPESRTESSVLPTRCRQEVPIKSLQSHKCCFSSADILSASLGPGEAAAVTKAKNMFAACMNTGKTSLTVPMPGGAPAVARQRSLTEQEEQPNCNEMNGDVLDYVK
jgi:hypothetical protein